MLNTNYIKCDQDAISLYNQDYSENYRQFDEGVMDTDSYQHFASILEDITSNFNRPIKVLEVGCGTGRYFHALKNTVELTGIDISGPMLKLAETPVKYKELQIPSITLIEDSIFDYDFDDEKFDFIYSIGVLGEHAPFTLGICDKLHHLLNDEGTMYITVMDIDCQKKLKRKLAETAYPILPGKLKHLLDKRWETNYMSSKELDNMMSESRFDEYIISKFTSPPTDRDCTHLECVAFKYDTISRAFFV